LEEFLSFGIELVAEFTLEENASGRRTKKNNKRKLWKVFLIYILCKIRKPNI